LRPGRGQEKVREPADAQAQGRDDRSAGDQPSARSERFGSITRLGRLGRFERLLATDCGANGALVLVQKNIPGRRGSIRRQRGGRKLGPHVQPALGKAHSAGPYVCNVQGRHAVLQFITRGLPLAAQKEGPHSRSVEWRMVSSANRCPLRRTMGWRK
jgi:hypothetical protein